MVDEFDPGSKVFVFGSFYLNVHNADSDVDMFCACPTKSESEFFSESNGLFHLLSMHPNVSHLSVNDFNL